MTARNPGPFLQQTPIGFPSYNRKMNVDWMARKAFAQNEVNGRVYKAIYENIGVKGSIPENKQVGRNRIRLRDIHNGYARGNFRWTKMNRHGFMQTMREGWLIKYGYDPDRFHFSTERDGMATERTATSAASLELDENCHPDKEPLRPRNHCCDQNQTTTATSELSKLQRKCDKGGRE